MDINLKFPKSAVLKRLHTNRENHRKQFLEAQEGYREKFIELLDEQLKRARGNQPFNPMVFHSLSAPQDMTAEYNTAIDMLEACSDPEIEMNDETYKQLMLDKWHWSERVSLANSLYTKKG